MVASPAFASPQEMVVTKEDFAEKKVYSPYAGRNYPGQVLFGDTHFHTNLSFDAGRVGPSGSGRKVWKALLAQVVMRGALKD